MTTPTSPGAATRRRDPERRRRQILEAAAELVVESGAPALTHRAVAARADMALGTLTRHFPSIDELREATLRMLGDEIDQTLDGIQAELAGCTDPADRTAALIHEFLLDSRQVHASMALATTGISDAGVRQLSLRWTERLTDILAPFADPDRALAVVLFLDGAMMHAALHEHPLSRESLTRAVRALLAKPDPEAE